MKSSDELQYGSALKESKHLCVKRKMQFRETFVFSGNLYKHLGSRPEFPVQDATHSALPKFWLYSSFYKDSRRCIFPSHTQPRVPSTLHGIPIGINLVFSTIRKGEQTDFRKPDRVSQGGSLEEGVAKDGRGLVK